MFALLGVAASCGPMGTAPTDSGLAADARDTRAYLGACNLSAMGLSYCQQVLEYRGPLTGQTLAQACASQRGMLLAECPSANRAGRCTIDNAQARQVLNYYAPAMADDIRMLCTNAGGTFEAN